MGSTGPSGKRQDLPSQPSPASRKRSWSNAENLGRSRSWILAVHQPRGAADLLRSTANAIAPEKDSKTFQDRVKDAVVERVMEDR